MYLSTLHRTALNPVPPSNETYFSLKIPKPEITWTLHLPSVLPGNSLLYVSSFVVLVHEVAIILKDRVGYEDIQGHWPY